MHAHYTQTGPYSSAAGACAWFAAPLARPRAVIILAVAAVLACVIIPFDRELMQVFSSFGGLGQRLGGDVKRELEFLQQFGDFVTVVITAVIIFLIDPNRRARVLDIILAVICNAIVMNLVKMFLGRPRPRILLSADTMPGHESIWTFAFAWGTYPLPRKDADSVLTYLEAYPWQVWKGISSDLWSMPSSHAGAAACLAAVLARIYPRLSPLLIVLVLIVGCARVLFGAHYPSDVVVGWAIGFCVGALVMDRRPSDRLFAR